MTETAFIKAVKQLLNSQKHLVPDNMWAIIAGGSAVHYWTQGQFTKDHTVYFAPNYAPALSMMHEDYQQDAHQAWRIYIRALADRASRQRHFHCIARRYNAFFFKPVSCAAR